MTSHVHQSILRTDEKCCQHSQSQKAGVLIAVSLSHGRVFPQTVQFIITGKSCLHSWNKGVHAKTQLSGSVSILTWNKKSRLNSMKVGFRGLGQKPNFQNSISLLFTKSVEL